MLVQEQKLKNGLMKQPRPMKAPSACTDLKLFRVRLLPALLCLAGLIPCVTSCKKAAAPAPPPPIVQVAEVVATNAPASTEFIGQLDSPQNVEIRARVEAFVDKMLFLEGTEVKEGDPLFRLDDRPYQERLAAANGSLAEARAALTKYEKDVARREPQGEKKADA